MAALLSVQRHPYREAVPRASFTRARTSEWSSAPSSACQTSLCACSHSQGYDGPEVGDREVSTKVVVVLSWRAALFELPEE